MKIHFFSPDVPFKIIRTLESEYAYKSQHLVTATLNEESTLCGANTNRVTKYKKEVTCNGCLKMMKYRKIRRERNTV